MNEVTLSNDQPIATESTAAVAAHLLAHAHDLISQARSALALLQQDVAQAQANLSTSQAVHLVEANEHLVLSLLRAQTDAEAAARDVSQQMLANELSLRGQRLEAENRQIQEASRLKSEFLANMSHELRTPLNAIIGFADLLVGGLFPIDSPKRVEFAGHIASSGRHLLQVINDVLDLSKVEAGKLSFSPEPLSLPQLVKEVIDILYTSASASGLTLHTDIDPDLGDLVLDRTRLKQVLYNYLSNAIKFTPKGGNVTVRARAEGSDEFRIEVEDTGIGIAAQDLPRLFVEFQQLDSGHTKMHQGTGLGLALTRQLVTAQGGTVGVRSTPGVGSVFHLVLKRDTRLGMPVADMATPMAESQSGQPWVLIINAARKQQLRMARAFTDLGYQVDAVMPGSQGVAQARHKAYGFIALDLDADTADCAGVEMLFAIRSQGLSREASVCAVSMGGEAGGIFAVADVLAKPIRAGQVVSAFSKLGLTGLPGAVVMVIDDDPRALELMDATLRGMGAFAACFQSGREALQDIERCKPAAIIVGLVMPELDGLAMLHALRQVPSCRHTPVFLWTGSPLSAAEHASLAQSAGVIHDQGGGGLEAMLDELQRRQQIQSL